MELMTQIVSFIRTRLIRNLSSSTVRDHVQDEAERPYRLPKEVEGVYGCRQTVCLYSFGPVCIIQWS